MQADYVNHMGDDLMVANAARVSFNKESNYEIEGDVNGDDWKFVMPAGDAKLIEYLADHNHWTPFAHPQITLRIKAPIFVRTQLFKHKVGFTENEVSRRYVDDEPQFFFPVFRQRPDNGMKQGSRDEFPANLERCEAILLSAHNIALRAYKMLLDENVAPEQARMVLPQSMYTEWYWTGSLAAFARMCKQRLDPHAQAETRELAQKISAIIEPLFPVSWSVLVGK
jgi:thymidylate synthase (FAD)